MISNWQELEKYTKKLLRHDQPERTPLSGGTKSEEDVVGINSVSQCKFTQDKNVSILEKDIARLISSSALLNKFPLFFNQSASRTTVAVPISQDTCVIVDMMLRLACLMQGIEQMTWTVRASKEIRQLRDAEKEVNRLKKEFSLLKEELYRQLKRLTTSVETKEADLLSYDLFEQGDANGAK